MNKQQAKKWVEAFKKAKFKCIVPDQVIEAMEVLKMIPNKEKREELRKKRRENGV